MMRASGRPATLSTRTSAPPSRRIWAPSRRLLALGMLGVLVIGAPLLFGGVFQWTILVIAGVAFSTLLVTIWAERGRSCAARRG